MNFFSFNFPLREYFFLYFARLPPHKFSNGPSLNLKVWDFSDHPLTVLVSKSGIFNAKAFQYKSFRIHGFDVLFDRPEHIEKGTPYRLEALISGPPSLKGTDGLDSVHSAGVTFQFISSVKFMDSKTNRSVGQFLEFIFREVRY